MLLRRWKESKSEARFSLRMSKAFKRAITRTCKCHLGFHVLIDAPKGHSQYMKIRWHLQVLAIAHLKAFDILRENPASDFPVFHLRSSMMVLADVSHYCITYSQACFCPPFTPFIFHSKKYNWKLGYLNRVSSVSLLLPSRRPSPTKGFFSWPFIDTGGRIVIISGNYRGTKL